MPVSKEPWTAWISTVDKKFTSYCGYVYEPGNLKCIYTLIKKHVIAKKHMKANNNSN